MAKRRIIDKRAKNYFRMDDAYLNGYAKKCGYKATLVYLCLCRHADKNQYCFPSLKSMSEKLGISVDSIKRGVQDLKKYNIIEVEQVKHKNGLWKNNSYTLVDKSDWYGRADSHHGDGGATEVPREGCEQPNGSATEVQKETHTEGNTLKEDTYPAKQSFAGSEINEIINIFYEYNPGLNHANKTQRKAVEWMLNKFGKEKTVNTVNYAISIQGENYAPTVTTPTEFKNNLGKIINYYKRENQSKKGRIESLY